MALCESSLAAALGSSKSPYGALIMSPFVHKVRTASRATAVQIAVKEGGMRRIVEQPGLSSR